MSEATDGSLLVVCAANVCRSPFAEFLLGQALPNASVSSLGVTARAGDPLCRFTEERITALAGVEQFGAEHSAARLDAESIASSDLILTASEAERSAVAVLDPSARPRVFTLVEAAHSARALGADAKGITLAELAARMHAQRGIVDLPPVRHRLRFSPFKAEYGIAIPDAHIGDTRRHDEVYRTVSEAVSMFTQAYSGTSPRGGASEPDAASELPAAPRSAERQV